MKRFFGQSFECVVLAASGVGLTGYVAFRCARGAARILRQALIEFVSG